MASASALGTRACRRPWLWRGDPAWPTQPGTPPAGLRRSRGGPPQTPHVLVTPGMDHPVQHGCAILALPGHVPLVGALTCAPPPPRPRAPPAAWRPTSDG